MQARSRNFHLLVGMVAFLALLSFGAARAATAETIDLSAIFTADCSAADSSDVAFLDDMQAAAAPAAPAGEEKKCSAKMRCSKDDFCMKADCKDKEGTCKEKPKTCPAQDIDPVCGCNHKTYNNECLAHKAGVNVAHKGKCEKKGK
jgi:hypothetical protein